MWSEQYRPEPLFPGEKLLGLAATDATHAWVTRDIGDDEHADAQIIRTSNGTDWAPAGSVETMAGDFTAMAFGDSEHGALTTSGGELWVSEDGGDSWTSQGKLAAALSGVDFRSAESACAVGQGAILFDDLHTYVDGVYRYSRQMPRPDDLNSAQATLTDPRGITTDPDTRDVFVTDHETGSIVHYDDQGFFAGRYGTPDGEELYRPWGIVYVDGMLLVADGGDGSDDQNPCLRLFGPDGTPIQIGELVRVAAGRP